VRAFIGCVFWEMSVSNSHMQGSHSVISNKPRLHTKINPYSYKKNRAIAKGTSGALPQFKICVPMSYLSPRLLHRPTSNIVFKKCFPPFGLWSPCCEILATGLNQKPENLSQFLLKFNKKI